MEMDTVAAVVASALPNAGFLMARWIGRKMSSSLWLADLKHPPWVTEIIQYALTMAWAVANFMMGHLSYIVWDKSDVGSRTGSALPMTSYVFLLLLFWTHYPIYLLSRSLKYGLVDILLTMVAAISTFVLFSQVTSQTTRLMSLFMVLLAHEVLYSTWLFMRNPSGRILQTNKHCRSKRSFAK
ncbi:hypothetical protein GE061_016670 [Apolygus lucorum]|uniref:Uncharacterized protein n=1 Tax=Apolygus lucorum TaxID=248454 RepID=A0A8S9XIX7_APOLU|nr:hypothetical protein GE061_016670 [Apolygus lucorum]